MIPLLAITPTGDRPESFALLERWMARQTRKPDEWVVVDDGREPTPCRLGQTVYRRHRGEWDHVHTLPLNLWCAREYTGRARKVLILEDDELYRRHYIKRMAEWLDHADAVGERNPVYYDLRIPGWRTFDHHQHVSLCRTGFTRWARPLFWECVEASINKDKPNIDADFWRAWDGTRHTPEPVTLSVSFKGVPGRDNPTRGNVRYNPDPYYSMLRRLAGEDAEAYIELAERMKA